MYCFLQKFGNQCGLVEFLDFSLLIGMPLAIPACSLNMTVQVRGPDPTVLQLFTWEYAQEPKEPGTTLHLPSDIGGKILPLLNGRTRSLHFLCE